MDIKVYLPCQECDALGVTETRVGVDRYIESDCSYCDDGLVGYDEQYDSIEDAVADYPDAIRLVRTDGVAK